MIRLSKFIFTGCAVSPITNISMTKFSSSTSERVYYKKKPYKKYFKNGQEANKAINEIAQIYNITQQVSRSYFKEYPASFLPDSGPRKAMEAKIKYLEDKASEKQGTLEGEIAKVFRSIVFRNKRLGFDFAFERLQNIFKKIEEVGMTKQQVQKIFTIAPHALHTTFNQVLDQKLSICRDYLKIGTKEALEIFEACPILLPASNRKFRRSIAELIHTYHYTYEQVINLMKQLGQVFLYDGIIHHDLHKLPKKWGLNGAEAKKLFIDNPILFFNNPYEILPLKVKIIRYLELPEYCGRVILTKYPEIFVYSVSSLEAKAVFIKTRLNLPQLFQFKTTSPQILLQLLTFKFNKTLRPRSQLLIKSSYNYNVHTIVQLMSIPQSQFINRIKISPQRFQQQKNRFPVTDQLDFFRRKAFQNTNLPEKFRKIVMEKYQK